MRRELARIEPWQGRIEARSSTALKREVARAFRRGELAAVGPMRHTDTGYAVEVWRLKGRQVRRVGRRPVLVAGGAALTLGAAAAAGWWLFLAAGPALLIAPLALLVPLVVSVVWPSRRHGCTTTVTITHRR